MILLSVLLTNATQDAAEIRRIYRLKDLCFERCDAKRLAPTDLPTFYAVNPDGSTVSHENIWKYMRWRFANQVACHRTEKPVKIEVKGDRALVEIRLKDDFTVRRKGNALQHRVETSHAWSTWQKTKQGWKQASLRFDSTAG